MKVVVLYCIGILQVKSNYIIMLSHPFLYDPLWHHPCHWISFIKLLIEMDNLIVSIKRHSPIFKFIIYDITSECGSPEIFINQMSISSHFSCALFLICQKWNRNREMTKDLACPYLSALLEIIFQKCTILFTLVWRIRTRASCFVGIWFCLE